MIEVEYTGDVTDFADKCGEFNNLCLNLATFSLKPCGGLTIDTSLEKIELEVGDVLYKKPRQKQCSHTKES